MIEVKPITVWKVINLSSPFFYYHLLWTQLKVNSATVTSNKQVNKYSPPSQ